MNITRHATFMALIAAAAISPLHAQNAQNTQNSQNSGFRIGTFQPQNPVAVPTSVNPVQGMTTPPIQGMTTPPILPLGGGIVTQQQPRTFGNTNSFVNVLGPGEVIFVPAGTLVIESGPGVASGAFLTAPQNPIAPQAPSSPSAPTGGRGSSAQIQRSTRTPNINEDPQDTKKTETTRLELGTPRDKVIEKYGNPIAFMMGMNGETLYFNGGVVIFVKDGVVATPGK